MSGLKKAVSYMIAATYFVFLFASGFDMTEEFMEKLDGKADRRLSGGIH